MDNVTNIKDTPETAIAVRKAADNGPSFTYRFKEPVMYNGDNISEVTCDWGKLTGQDSLDIEHELQSLGKFAVSPAFSGEFIVRMAARVSYPRVGVDFFSALPLLKYDKFRSAGRSFLLRSE